MNKQQFIEAIEQHPALTASGIGVTNGRDLAAERTALADYFEAFSKSLEFLSSKSPEELKKLFQRGSYALKHIVERVVDMYVPEGAFDLATLTMECTVIRTIKDSPSVYFALSEVPSLEADGQPNMQI